MSAIVCPRCGATGTHIVGHEVRGVYDGVLFWSCVSCNRAWPRERMWLGTFRADMAEQYANSFNEGARAGEAME